MNWAETKKIFQSNPTNIHLENLVCGYSGRLSINVDDSTFETCLLPHTEKKLFVILTAINSRVSYPRFIRQRWSMFLDGYCLYIDDPTRMEHSLKFHPCFYFGNTEKNYCDLIIKIIVKIAAIHKIKTEDIIFIGSSNAGFACLYMSCTLKKSKCIAHCPQFSIKTYFGPHYKIFEREFNINLDSNDIQYRVNLIDMLKSNIHSQIVIYSNTKCLSDYNQIKLLYEAYGIDIKNGIEKINNNLTVIIADIDAPDPHIAQPGIPFIKYIYDHMLQNSNYDTLYVKAFLDDMKFQFLNAKYLSMESKWSTILSNFISHLPSSLSPKTNYHLPFQQFLINGVPQYIHYEFAIIEDRHLYFCIHYEKEYSDEIKIELNKIASSINITPIELKDKILINKKILVDDDLAYIDALSIINNTLPQLIDMWKKIESNF